MKKPFFIIIVFGFLYTSCNYPDLANKELDTLAVICNGKSEPAHKSTSRPELNEVAGKATSTCKKTNTALGGAVWVEY